MADPCLREPAPPRRGRQGRMVRESTNRHDDRIENRQQQLRPGACQFRRGSASGRHSDRPVFILHHVGRDCSIGHCGEG